MPESPAVTSALLDDVTVLDLTDERGEVGPALLARLGADVIRIEPPEGCQSRRQGPATDGVSFAFEAFNRGKRSIALDPDSESDRAVAASLVAAATMVFTSAPTSPPMLERYGLSRKDVVELQPSIIHVTISPFGSDGPRAEQPASELTVAALGGPVRLQGDPTRPPVKASVPQVWRHAGAEAALASLVALHREDAGAQFVDVSAQAAMTWTLLNAMEAHAIQGFDFERTGATLELAMTIPLRHAALDGWVVLVPRGPTIHALLDPMIAQGVIDESWRAEDWATWDPRIIDGEATQVSHRQVLTAVGAFTSKFTKAELLELGQQTGVTIAPINDLADLLAFEHLQAREFWEGEATERLPGSPVTLDGVRLATPAPAPGLDEHRSEILAQLAESSSRPLVHTRRRDDNQLPLAGVKVADFSWVGVGPITARCLADHGAEVVRVESSNRIDALRGQPPFKDATFGFDRSQFFGAFNTSKQGLSIDLKTEGGVDVARRLTDWADVVIDSWTPGAMSRLGLGPEDIRKSNPSVITVTTSLLGGGGPYSSMAGYGYHAAAIAGFFGLVGYPNQAPDGPWLAYTDTIGPRFITPTLLAAIARQQRTGEGCHIEAAQLEMALQFLAPELLRFQRSGQSATLQGNRDERMAPQGVYRCRGEDCWIAISVPDDATWRRLRLVLGDPEWTQDPKLAAADVRQVSHDAIDVGIEAWTLTRDEDEVERLLTEAGVPAAKVQRSSDLLADPQYSHRGFYSELEHAEMGTTVYAGHQYRIEGYDHGPRFAAPTLGQHTFEILTELLDYSAEEFADLAADGALT